MRRLLAGLLLAGVACAADFAKVGMTGDFPKSIAEGQPVEFQLWQWGSDPAARKELLRLAGGAKIPYEGLPKGLQFRFRIPATHDAVRCLMRSTDSFDKIGWGPEAVERQGSAAWLYRAYAEHMAYPPQAGRYYIEVEATDGGKMVAKASIAFEFVRGAPPPRDTQVLAGKQDCKGNAITSSKPVALPPLNESALLRDNDYPFEPQHAFNTINFERFPPFQLPPRFLVTWNSRRFVEERLIGGPLERGFNNMATVIAAQDNLRIPQRAWFHTPDQQVAIINQWLKKDATKFADLKAYADHRSAFVSAESAYRLGWASYEGWGAGGFGPYDAGLYGWDEEQMWPTIAAKLLKEHPELVPEKLRELLKSDPEVKSPHTLHVCQETYIPAWGDFVGHTYRGARDCAAQRGRTFKVWHYGSKAPGENLFVGREDGLPDPKTGAFKYEQLSALWPWFRTGEKIDFSASEYARQIDYFHKDFYYHTLFPQTLSLYVKDQNGAYALDEKGRRRMRTDVAEETVYVAPIKIAHEDYEIGPVFLKSFLAKGENALFWLNGGKYYKRRGTLITDKQLIPALRPGNQETWGECAKLGSRPVNPYLAEAAVIYTFMMGLEGLYYWDARGFSGPEGFGRNGDTNAAETLGEIEFVVKGLQRVAQFTALFEGDYAFVRPVRHYDTYNRDHPIIRGIINGRDLLLALTNPYLDPGETQQIELWYDAPYAEKKKLWSDTLTLESRKTRMVQCRLPAPPNGAAYDPDKLYFRYTCVDGRFEKTFTVTGNYDVTYPY